MRAYLSFNLPEEKDSFEIAHRAGEYYSVCWDFSERLRRVNKHQQEIPEQYLKIINQLWEDCGGNDLVF